jgi:hypothetical protein
LRLSISEYPDIVPPRNFDDIVILALMTGNDLTDDVRAFDSVDPMRPYFFYKNGELVADDSFRRSASCRVRQTPMASVGFWVIGHSRVVQVLNAAQHMIRKLVQERSQAETEDRGKDGKDEEIGLDDNVYSEPSDPLWQEAWRVTEALIVLMRDEVKKTRSRFRGCYVEQYNASVSGSICSSSFYGARWGLHSFFLIYA